MKKIVVPLLLLNLVSYFLSAQDKNLGDKEYVIVKDYRPVLAESNKINDQPQGDTTTAPAPKLEYSPSPVRMETNFEAGVIRAVKIKDEPISKLYHSLLKLGLGNYTTYYGELFYNTLRSKKGQAGLHLNHLSGNPKLGDVGETGFSQSTAEVYGKYFLDHSEFNGRFGLDQRVLHYYGYNPGDTLIPKDAVKQRYNDINLNVGYKTNWISDEHLQYNAGFDFHQLTDLFNVTENNFIVNAGAEKKIKENNAGLLLSFDYFKKSNAYSEFVTELIDLNSNLARNIVSIEPYLKKDFEKAQLTIGANFTHEKNIGDFSKFHVYPDVRVVIPIAEQVIYIYGNVTGGLEKINYRTLSYMNPFISPVVKPYRNQSNDIVLNGGLKGNFSRSISFDAGLKYTSFTAMPFFHNGSLYFNEFNIYYGNGTVLDIHGELSFKNEKLHAGLTFDQYSYTIDQMEGYDIRPFSAQRAWHKPTNETKLFVKYNLQDKILANIYFFFRDKQFALDLNTVEPQKIKGYSDVNLNLEYRYTKILSFYLNLNNLSFKSYQQWYNFPTERFNLLGGMTYAF